jgi:hypothetical protein
MKPVNSPGLLTHMAVFAVALAWAGCSQPQRKPVEAAGRGEFSIPAGRVPDLKPIEGITPSRAQPRPQIQLEARFITMSHTAWQAALGGAALPEADRPLVLSAEQAAVLEKPERLQAAQGTFSIDVLSLPPATIPSERQSIHSVNDLVTIITGIKQAALRPPGVTGAADGGLPTVLETAVDPLGPTLNLLAVVAEDGKTIGIRCEAAIREFHGYARFRDDQQTVYVNGKSELMDVPRPLLLVEQFIGTSQVQDGQSLLVAGAVSEESTWASADACGIVRLLCLTPRVLKSTAQAPK